jgi:long-chain fatty acid transport protein
LLHADRPSAIGASIHRIRHGLGASTKLAIGGGPIISVVTPRFNPAFVAPGPSGPLGLPTFPSATNARPYWGAGFQVGLLYELNSIWNLGFSSKSPIWQEKWDFNASTPTQAARTIGIQAQLPQMLSWGLAYKGLPKTPHRIPRRDVFDGSRHSPAENTRHE